MYNFCIKVCGDFFAAVEEAVALRARGLELPGEMIEGIAPDELYEMRCALTDAGVCIAVVDAQGGSINALAKAALQLGAKYIRVTPEADDFCIRTVKSYGMEPLLENGVGMANDAGELLSRARELSAGVIFDPRGFVLAGRHPFFGVLYKSGIKERMRVLRVRDALFSGEAVAAGQGNGEIEEVVSAMLCRSYDGWFAFDGKPDDVRRDIAFLRALLKKL